MPDAPDASSNSSSRSGLSPAAWGAISAIAVAVIGGGVSLTSAWWSQHRVAAAAEASPAAAPPAKSSAAASASDVPQAPGVSALTGRWRGEALLAGEPTQRVEVQIAAGCALGGACGWIAVPDVPCKGRLTLVGPTPRGWEFRVDDFDASSDAQRCQAGGGEVLRAAGDGTLIYTATYSGASGVLRPAS